MADDETGALALPGQLPRLTHDELVRAQAETLGAPRRRYGVAARALFVLLDLVYGKGRTLNKFKVLELIARVPYQSWEQVAYIAITHMHQQPAMARRIHDRIAENREQQDNELWHLLILEELVAQFCTSSPSDCDPRTPTPVVPFCAAPAIRAASFGRSVPSAQAETNWPRVAATRRP